MKAKIKLILLTFIGTTLFWCLTIAGLIWSSVNGVMAEAKNYGYNFIHRESNPSDCVTAVIADVILTNTTTKGYARRELKRTDVLPGQTLVIGIRTETTSKKVALIQVMGEVLSPDRYRWTNGMTLRDAITLAGGFTDLALQSNLEIHHADGSIERLNFAKLETNGVDNPALKSGDTVTVEKKPL